MVLNNVNGCILTLREHTTKSSYIAPVRMVNDNLLLPFPELLNKSTFSDMKVIEKADHLPVHEKSDFHPTLNYIYLDLNMLNDNKSAISGGIFAEAFKDEDKKVNEDINL